MYLAALLAALGAFAVQLLGGHHDASGGHDASQGAGSHDHESYAWSLVASIRFWSFSLLAFGLVGTALTALGLAGTALTAVLATGSGLGSGAFAASVIRTLASRSATSHVAASDVVGRVGRVLVPLVPGGRGKVRVEVKGSVVDYVARSKETVAAGEPVLVEEAHEGEVVVSRAPKELAP
jgi:membrane protein implicated in regulation of membrane protease activity